MNAVKIYPLKNADNSGGYIETDWIYEENQSSSRCLIKLQVLSLELVSTGIETKIICEVKKQENWIPDKISYFELSHIFF